MNVQDAIFRLSHFWAGEGCLVLPACELEVPSGILHPDAFFRLLDSRPWRAAYLQMVRRPLDSRYGRHPFRLGRHLQFQVILKAPPDDVRDRYVRSLEDLGLRLAVHDLRFTEWSWEALSLDAWGLGWQVHLDGLAVTRLTFLQQVAGHELDPVAAEISYGVERLLMAVTRTRNAFRLPWSEGGPEYGELWRREEEELSRYALEVADVSAVERRLANLRDETRLALDAGLLRLAYELAVRSLNGIDLLETRGELSSAERTERLGGVRELVNEVARRHLADQAPAKPGAGEAGGETAETVETEAGSAKAGRAKKKKGARARRAKKRKKEPT